MRVAIMDSGSLGSLFGALLASAGAEVLFIARGAQLAAMQTTGLRILSDGGDITLSQVSATADPTGIAPVDFVIFTVKGQDTETAAELVAPLVGSDTGIISFQNGVQDIDILADRFSPEAVLPGTTMTMSLIEAPGVIRHVGNSKPVTIGEWHDQRSDRLHAFAAMAERAGLDVTISENIHVDVWIKFVAMATTTALTSLTRLPVRRLATTPETRQLMIDGYKEIIAVAAARGITLPADLPATFIAMAETCEPTWKTSMCNDLEAGKAIELEIASGAVHRLGQELGVPTPVHTVAYRALKPFAA